MPAEAQRFRQPLARPLLASLLPGGRLVPKLPALGVSKPDRAEADEDFLRPRELLARPCVERGNTLTTANKDSFAAHLSVAFHLHHRYGQEAP
jgi:hypothetical protein